MSEELKKTTAERYHSGKRGRALDVRDEYIAELEAARSTPKQGEVSQEELWNLIRAYGSARVDCDRSNGEISKRYLAWAESNLRDALAAPSVEPPQAAEHPKLGVHLSHCNFGEHAGSCKYGEDDDCPALSENWSWFGAQLQRAAQIQEAAHQEPLQTAKQKFDRFGGSEEESPIERLRFFCAQAMNSQDWIDVEPFFDALVRPSHQEPGWQPIETAPKVGVLMLWFPAMASWIAGPWRGYWSHVYEEWTIHSPLEVDRKGLSFRNLPMPTHWMPLPSVPKEPKP